MKRLIVLVMILGMVVGSLASAEAAKKKKKVTREAQATYTSTGVVAAGNCTQMDAVNCPRIPSGLGEKYLTAKVTDASGQAVPVAVKADLDGDNSTEKLYGVFCGETTEPIKIDPGVEITFWVGVTRDTAALGCAGATQGTVDAVFSNMP